MYSGDGSLTIVGGGIVIASLRIVAEGSLQVSGQEIQSHINFLQLLVSRWTEGSI